MAVGGNFNARGHKLAVALRAQGTHLLRRLVHRQRAHGAARVGNDAVSAEVHAAVLDLEHRAGAVRHAARRQHLERAAAQRVVDVRDRLARFHGLLQPVKESRAVVRAHQKVDAEALCLLLVRLDVAAAGGDHRVGTILLRAADHLA